MLPELAAALLLIGLAAYVVLGGADFGAGFWDLTAGGAERGAPVRAWVKRGMSPVWEANHVWLIFVLVVLWTAFPEAFGSIMSTLAIPLFLAALGIVRRGGGRDRGWGGAGRQRRGGRVGELDRGAADPGGPDLRGERRPPGRCFPGGGRPASRAARARPGVSPAGAGVGRGRGRFSDRRA